MSKFKYVFSKKVAPRGLLYVYGMDDFLTEDENDLVCYDDESLEKAIKDYNLKDVLWMPSFACEHEAKRLHEKYGLFCIF